MNGYDLSFLRWMRRHGASIDDFLGEIAVHANGRRCPFRVRSEDLERYEQAGFIEKFFPGTQADTWQNLWRDLYRLTNKPIPE